MTNLVAVVALLALIGIGVFLIHLVNTQQEARIATHHFGDRRPGIGRRSRRRHHRRQASADHGQLSHAHPDAATGRDTGPSPGPHADRSGTGP
ncbi:hypothetical protein [Streptomyces albipurpureus]|uniref:Secreted protein n=1 Tax=Streptomyces albipurpureus TaxID=2897419 RepID=A0ABT0URW3_9ACTN|nr:hypothetical protein [Streptomyces sp. CWNU-1]MCM2391354.1 hypothetical protein [Streptomyces sp. CWNU-1]